jgi:PKD repeat protein
MKTKLLVIFLLFFQLKMSAQNCTYNQVIDTVNNTITFTATDTLSAYNYIFVFDTTTVLTNLTGGHSATYQAFLNDTLPHEICLKIVDLINQVVICESCTIFQLGTTVPPPNPSCAFTYYFSNDTLYASQTGSITPADYVWNMNGNFYSGAQLALYVGNIDSVQVNLNGQNVTLGTSCFNTIYAVNPFYVPVIAHCNTDFVNVYNGLTSYFIDITSDNIPQQSIYYWTFGDGNSSNSRNVQHTYLVDGDYNVCLWVKDTMDINHCNDTICKLITVSNSPLNDTCSALFVFTQIQTFNIGAINLASGINPVFSWNFGDGLQSIVSGPYPSYTYMNAGTYEVCLTLTTDSCSATYCDSLTVDSAGIMRDGMQEGFTINVLSPAQVTGMIEAESNLNNNISMKIYPNPSTGIFTISSAANIEVYNIVGEFILFENNATSIDINTAPNGMYFVKLNGGKIEKLIKN